MVEFRQSLTIRRPPEAVFDLLTRFEDIPKFVPQVSSAEQTSAGPVGVGTTFVQRSRVLAWTIETSTIVTTFEPPRRFRYRAERGVVPYDATYDFHRMQDGTQLEARVIVSLRGVARRAEPLIGRLVKRTYRSNLQRMRDLLEQPTGSAAAPGG